MALSSAPKVPNVPPVKERYYTAGEVIEALQRAHGLVTAAARILGCTSTTVDRYVRDFPTVAAAKKQAREGVLDLAEAGLYQSIRDREPWAIKYYLSTQGHDRGYVEKRQIDHTGSIGSYTIDLGGEDDGSTGTK